MANYRKKILILAPLLIIIAIASSFLLNKAIIKSNYFNIKKIILNTPSGSSSLSSHSTKGEFDIHPPRDLLAKNLFSIDLDKLEKKFLFIYPELRKINISRSLPDTLIIDIEPRLPVAKLKFASYNKFPSFRGKEEVCIIDNEAFVLDLSDKEKYGALPQIYGLNKKAISLKFGQIIKSDKLSIALVILEEYKKMGDLKQCIIEEINVSDLSKAFLNIRLDFQYLPDNRRNKTRQHLKVIIGKDEIKRKLKILSSLLYKIKSSLKDIKYIDLRFKDPVAGSR